jgi:hypothetical protein
MSRTASFIKKPGEQGQALVEFVIVLPLLSLIFMGILYFGLAGTGSLGALVEARNAGMRGQGRADSRLFRKYINETPEATRFVLNYEMKINPAGLDFRQYQSEAGYNMSKAAFPSLLRGFRYRTQFAVDRPGTAVSPEMKAKAVETLAEDLFGIRDTEGGVR